MFKLQKPNSKPSKPRERVDFKFSNCQLLQVPKGWDMLLVSLISLETGKTFARLGKALVRNGNCQWTEVHSESIRVSQNDSSKESEESLIKLVVSMGSSRSSILGEVNINLARYTSSKIAAAVSQPLNKCGYGTILQLKIQCLSPRSKIRNENSKHSTSEDKEQNVENLELCSNSTGSNHSSDGINEIPTNESAATIPRLLKLESKVISQSAGGPFCSFDSIEEVTRKDDSLSSRNGSKGEEYNTRGRRDGRIDDGSVLPDNLSFEDSASNHSSQNSHIYPRDDSQNQTVVAKSSSNIISSTKSLLEAAENTIEELRAEAKMWERNARKLVIDLDVSRKELSDQSKKQAELVIERSFAYSEHDGLKREIECLKLELQDLRAKCTQEDFSIQSESLIHVPNILENEIKYQQNLNANLGEQLKWSQESNVQLVSVLQELEETIEQQKVEIENLSSLKPYLADLESSIAQESEKKLQAGVFLLDKALKDRTEELVNAQNSNSQILFQVEKDYKSQISLKEEEIARLETNLSRHVDNEIKLDLIQEIESLREKVQELENDCTELTDENLELLLKLKESNKKGIRKCPSFGSVSSEHPTVCPSDDSDVSDPKSQIYNSSEEVPNAGFECSEHFTEILKQLEIAFHLLMKPLCSVSSMASEESLNFFQDFKNSSTEKAISGGLLELNKLLELRTTECEDVIRGHELEIKEWIGALEEEVQRHEKSKTKLEKTCADLLKELDQKRLQLDCVESNLLSKDEENKSLLQYQRELEVEIDELQRKTNHLEQNMEVVLRENDMKSEYFKNLENDITILRNSADSYISAKTILERKSEELQRERDELESIFNSLQEDNFQCQECICRLETEVQHLKEEKELFRQETDKSKSVAMNLQEEIEKLKSEIDSQMLNLEQESEQMQKQWLKAQTECEDLKEDNRSLRASASSFAQERIELQNSDSELRRENQKLKEHCSAMVAQLTNSKKSLSDCTKKVEYLEDHLYSVLEDFDTRENCLKSEVDTLVEEIKDHKNKLALQETWHQDILEKTLNFENLRNEVEHLSKEISDVNEEKEIISSEAAGEVSRLLAEKEELQRSFQESESKFKVLSGQLAASQQSHGIMLADHERASKSLANQRRSEDKLKTDINDLELKLTISDYERLQLTKEVSILKVQLQNLSSLRDESLVLKGELQESLIEKGNLELAFRKVTGYYEEMKAENALLSEKITSFQTVFSECEENKRKTSALQEKITQKDSELTAKEVLLTQNSNLKDELAEIKRANSQFQQKILTLEEEKDECFKKACTLEEELELMERRYHFHQENPKDIDFYDESPLAIGMDPATKMQLLESKVAEALDENNQNRVQKNRFISTSQKNFTVSSKKPAGDGGTGTQQKYERTKSSLETELRDLRERYLTMSLKYAEVEAQRENLVMKLKVTNSANRWFS
ncbi:uncharacterized protein LOC142546299 isoform X2 [Primulina tabacum]|uniref:uncharacterized protein LOC142546299 isoform X2 n=1 Tax=Primulina tabacum TaxID=48773 RepID=UPI003F59DECA